MQESRQQALQAFSKRHAPDARALVQASHTADQGFVAFVVPIILDTLFNRLAPWLFGMSTIKMMQLSSMRFIQVQRKKRQDRLLQVLILGALVTALVRGAVWLMRLALGRVVPVFA